MKTFEYKGYTLSGSKRKGLVEAMHPKAAKEILVKDGILVESNFPYLLTINNGIVNGYLFHTEILKCFHKGMVGGGPYNQAFYSSCHYSPDIYCLNVQPLELLFNAQSIGH